MKKDDIIDLTKKRCSTCDYNSFCKSISLLKRMFGCRFWTKKVIKSRRYDDE